MPGPDIGRPRPTVFGVELSWALSTIGSLAKCFEIACTEGGAHKSARKIIVQLRIIWGPVVSTMRGYTRPKRVPRPDSALLPTLHTTPPLTPMRFVIPILLLVSAVSAFRDHCESFKLDGPPFVRSSAATVPADLEHVALVASTYYENTARVNLSSSASLLNSDKLVGFCRVELSITTNKTSGNVALTEVWLPDDWNHRILGVGNGGWAGGSKSVACTRLKRGFRDSTFTASTLTPTFRSLLRLACIRWSRPRLCFVCD